jgi:squalene synthase HpnC
MEGLLFHSQSSIFDPIRLFPFSMIRGFMTGPELDAAYRHCFDLARTHYENFPVASRFLPAEHRPALAAVYAFARTADDFADEGIISPDERLRKLDHWHERLERAVAGSADHPIFIALADTIRRYAIPTTLFENLLTAFRWDVTKQTYESFQDVLEYCRNSANPVGRIVLHIFGTPPEEQLTWSDAICTALQLANFWQDVSVDTKKGRIYAPLEDLRRFRYTQEDLFNGLEDVRFQELIHFQVDRTRSLFNAGRPLLRASPKLLRLELTLTWNGGMRILDMIERLHYRVLSQRPTLRWRDKLSLVAKSMMGFSR